MLGKLVTDEEGVELEVLIDPLVVNVKDDSDVVAVKAG